MKSGSTRGIQLRKRRVAPIGELFSRYYVRFRVQNRPGTLARIALLKQPTLTKVIDRMERLDLVERRESLSDRRQVLVRITREGRRVVRGLLRRAKRHEGEVLADYDAIERAQLKAALRTLIERLADGRHGR